MRPRGVYLWVGLGLLLLGGALLALGPERLGTPLGTTLGLAGLGLILWSWSRRA